MMGFRRPGRDLESQLRRERPTPPDALVQQISRSTGQRVVRRGRRVGFALAMTLALAVAFSLTGGIGYASSSIEKSASTIGDLVSVKSHTNGNSGKGGKLQQSTNTNQESGNEGTDTNGNSGKDGNNGAEDKHGDNGDDGGSAGDQYRTKVLICHIPPGNPANAHTISVSPNAVPAHLAHGDYLGPCIDE